MDHKQFGTWALFDVGIWMRILLFPFMPHIGNTRRVRKPWPHIFYNTIGHPFPHSINMVPQFDFSSLINRVFPEPTFVQCSPVRLVIFSSSHVILNMCFAIAKVFATVGRYTWRLPTVNTHFELVPSCISYCGDKVKQLLERKRNWTVMKSDMIVQLVFPPAFYFGQFLCTFFMFHWQVCPRCSIKYCNKYNL